MSYAVSDHKEGGEVGVTLMIARNGLNPYDVAQEDTEDGGDLVNNNNNNNSRYHLQSI